MSKVLNYTLIHACVSGVLSSVAAIVLFCLLPVGMKFLGVFAFVGIVLLCYRHFKKSLNKFSQQ
jgi:hypothetical protein